MAKGLRIIALKDGFRRAGIAHSTTPTDHLLSDFNKEQIAALRAEKNLVVQDVEIKEAKAE